MGLALVEAAFEWYFSELHAVSVNDVIVIRILVLLTQAIRAPADHPCRALTAQRRFGHFPKLHLAQVFDLLFLDTCILIGNDSHPLMNRCYLVLLRVDVGISQTAATILIAVSISRTLCLLFFLRQNGATTMILNFCVMLMYSTFEILNL